eukprot:m.34996 g.34996  ORF g.34996 m.34996 type:complete len:182 (-) comp9975_c0_seq2:645-1190(-)
MRLTTLLFPSKPVSGLLEVLLTLLVVFFQPLIIILMNNKWQCLPLIPSTTKLRCLKRHRHGKVHGLVPLLSTIAFMAFPSMDVMPMNSHFSVWIRDVYVCNEYCPPSCLIIFCSHMCTHVHTSSVTKSIIIYWFELRSNPILGLFHILYLHVCISSVKQCLALSTGTVVVIVFEMTGLRLN